MPRLNLLSCFLVSLFFIIANQSCNKTGQAAKVAIDSAQINRQIADGNRVENVNNDSLLMVAQMLYRINNLSGDKRALVFAEVFNGLYCWQAADHEKAMELAIKSLGDAHRYNIRQALPRIFGLIGNLHKETTNYDMAFAAADSAIKAAFSNKDTSAIIATLGLKAMFTRGKVLKFNQPYSETKSLVLNLQALKMAESKPKYEPLRIRFYCNISSYYKDKGDYDSAFYYGDKAVALSKKYGQQRSLTYAYCWLGEANYYKGNKAIGIAYLNQAMQIARNLNQAYRVMEIYEGFFNCYETSGDYKEAMHYYAISRQMRDSLKLLDNVKQISELQVKYEAVQKDENIRRLKAKGEIAELQYSAVIIVLISVSIIAILIYLKEKKSKKLIAFEKSLVDNELKNATLELQYFTANLKQKNEIIEEFRSKVDHLHRQHVNKADIEGLDELMKEHIMTDESWDNFKRLFAKVHTRFFGTLKKKFPDLTATDTRMLSLIKLQLSNSEMANMLGVTLEGIRKSKQRLRKKMELHPEEDLESTVGTF